MKRVAINGLGRIGRALLKIIVDEEGLELVAVNDLMEPENMAYLLRYDTVYGNWDREVVLGDGTISIDGAECRLLQKRDPAALPWGDLGVDVALECTGVFRTGPELRKHLEAGAAGAVLSAPPKGGDVPSVVPGVNPVGEEMDVLSCASCTTNCIAPVVEVVGRRIGVAKAVMTTIHGYTSTQALVDSPAGKMRRGRAGAMNMVPTTTGAAKATTVILPRLEERFDGVAVRTPVPCGSIADMTFSLERAVTVEEVGRVLMEEADSDRYRGILGVTDEPVVSWDVIGDSRASLVDLPMTRVVDGDLLKVMSWYDNEWGYAAQMVRATLAMGGATS